MAFSKKYRIFAPSKCQLNMKASQSRVNQLRELMQKQGIDLYIMGNNDPHESEYLPDHWKEIEWLSGFRGEVATVLVTQEEALLWTDSRFFISGEQQLADSPFKLMKMKVAGVPTVAQWLDDYKAQHDTNCTGGDSRILFGTLAILAGGLLLARKH